MQENKMSFWDYMFDTEYKQRSDIESLKARASRQSRSASGRTRQIGQKVEDMEELVGDLEEQIGGLMLINTSLMTYLRRRADWNELEFQEILEAIDLEDGELDGK